MEAVTAQLPMPPAKAVVVQPPVPTVRVAVSAWASELECARMPDVGQDPKPPMPQAEGVETSPVAPSGCAGGYDASRDPRSDGQGLVSTRGALTDALNMLARLEVDFREAEVPLTVEHARLATRWRQLEAFALEARGDDEGVRAEC